jgi:UDP:flavonoid glycosyltransferase YjiC (YdhE family)
MKKFLFTTLISNDLGLLTRSLPIARELQERGHQVAFCNPARAPSKLISDAGFENLRPKWPLYYIISGDMGVGYSRLFRSGHLKRNLGILVSAVMHMKRFSTAEFWNLDHFMWFMGMWNENFVRADVNDLMELIDEYNPDAVVDFWNVSACIAARACHKPLITVIQADVHPQSQGFIWWKEHPHDIPTPVPSINKILAELKLNPISKTGELLIGDITMVVGMPETDPLPETANVTYIGPVLWQRSDAKLPDWVAGLNTMKPVVWVYPGNPQYARGNRMPADSAVVTHACIEALKDKELQVVLTTGHHSLPRETLPLPANFRHASFVPGLAMAERSDLLIHHGGYGSCQTGLFTGTPALVIPTYSERESNARRIAAVGAGDFVLPTADATGTKKQVKATEVSDKVDHILSDSSYKENSRRISEKLRSYGGASYAASLIEELVHGLDKIETKNI